MPTPSTHDALLNYQQAARLLNVHPDTVRRYWKQGLLPVVRLPKTGNRPGLIRFRKTDVEALLTEEEKPNGDMEVTPQAP